MRANCDLFIYLDVPRLLAGKHAGLLAALVPALDPDIRLFADGVPVFTSTNNVVLTAGVDGVVPPKYFSKVVKKDGEVLIGA